MEEERTTGETAGGTSTGTATAKSETTGMQVAINDEGKVVLSTPGAPPRAGYNLITRKDDAEIALQSLTRLELVNLISDACFGY
jgi:hypothetical protein